MIWNYLTIAFRYFTRSSVFSVVNLAGLAVGITASSLLFLYVWDELRHDRFHANAERIFRVTTSTANGYQGVVTPGPLGTALKEEHPEIKDMVRIAKWSGTWRLNDQLFEEQQVFYVDAAFLTMFDFPLIVGDAKTALSRIDGLVITERMAEKYFGKQWRSREDLIGSTLILNSKAIYTLQGVAANPPGHSSINFDFLMSFEHIVQNDKWGYQWSSHNFHTYVELHEFVDVTQFSDKIRNDLARQKSEANFLLGLQPLSEIYLSPINGYDWGKHGQKQYVITFGLTGIVILTIACFNYINLTTARARKRSREVGIRKVIGATRHQLIFQFMGESTLMVVAAVFIARGVIDLVMPFFNQISGKSLEASTFSQPLITLLSIIAFLTSLLAGVYPALIMSSFKSAQVLKGLFSHNTGKNFRASLVTTQFAISMILIAGTITIYQQMMYVQSRETGFDKNELMYIRLGASLKSGGYSFKEKVLQLPGIRSAAVSTTNLVNTDNGSYFNWPGKTEGHEVSITQLNTDEDFIPMLGVRLLAGRNFTAQDSGAYVVNRNAVAAMGLTPENAIGLPIEFWGTPGKIIGVVEDFHFRPMYHAISPLIIRHAPEEFHFNLLCQVSSNKIPEFISALETTYKSMKVEYPLHYGFVDDQIQAEYDQDRKASTVMTYFSGLSIFISVLGLFGLIAYNMEERVKEFGIRRVLGASGVSIFVLLSKHFFLLLLIACAIATPVTIWLAELWLENFSYHINVSPLVFIFTFVGVCMLSLGIILSQSLKATTRRTADALRMD